MTSGSGRQNSRATLQAVAELAAVSATTVSLVLSGKANTRRISAETHVRVKQAAEALNYAPNLLTRSLRQGRTNIFSFFSTFRNREEDDLYMDRMVSAVEGAAGQSGYDVLVHCNFKRSPKEIYQFLNGGIAEGLLLFAPPPNDPLLPILRKSTLPVVIINGRDPLGQYPSVAEDTVHGMQLVAEALLAHGHKNAAILVAEDSMSLDSKNRVMLLQDHYRRAGHEIATSAIYKTPANAAHLLEALMSRPEPPTALFCWHDRLAYRVLAACEQIGIPVPGQLSVVGYDGIHWPSKTSHQATSVKVDLHGLARKAVSLLDRYISSQPECIVTETEPVSFLVGTSLGPARTSTLHATEQHT
jgi:DNA-binding LacI/PurR family transcriptional regulator